MSARSLARTVLPSPLYQLGRQGFAYIRRTGFPTVVGCSTSQKVIALTFDDGPGEYTPEVLALLGRYGIKATFFLLGQNVAAAPDTARAIVRAGHAIGNHTFSHPRLSRVSLLRVAGELRQCQRMIRQVTGTRPHIMRPPQAAQTLGSYVVARMLGYTTVHWSASGDDWLDDPAAVIAERVLRKATPGGIILLHDSLQPLATAGEAEPEYERRRDRTPTITALPIIIQQLQREGYQFVTIPQLLEIKPLIKKIWFEKGQSGDAKN
jgi:peptidoglycan/xylan/chitin deacetylase (PgdA/CDA1 family)